METILNKESRAAIELMVADGIITKDTAERYFPELKESEDETIREELISLFEDNIKGIRHLYRETDCERWLAWLKKQGEQKSIEYPLCKTVKDKIDYYIINHFTTDTVVKTDVNSIVKAMEEGVMIGMSEQNPLKVYRVENEAEEKGLWRKFDGTWQPLFDMLTDGKCKDMPMEDNPIYREGGKRWFASAPSKEALREWFSERDLEELVSKGFTITEFEVTEYKKVSDFEYIFTRDSIINKSYLKVSDIYSEQKLADKVEPKFKVGDWILVE